MDHYFDRYDLRARLSVAILMFAPLICDISFCFDYHEGSVSAILLTVIVIALSCCGIAFVRYCGNRSDYQNMVKYSDENEKEVPHRPTLAARMLLIVNDDCFSQSTLDRYYSILKKANPDLKEPIDYITKDNTSREEKLKYSCSIVDWIVTNTRNSSMFPLLVEEKINYGFAKNLCAVKPFAIWFLILESLVAITVLICKIDAPCFIDRVKAIWSVYTSELLISGTIHVAVLIVWIIIARQRFLDCANYRVAREILKCIDSLQTKDTHAKEA